MLQGTRKAPRRDTDEVLFCLFGGRVGGIEPDQDRLEIVWRWGLEREFGIRGRMPECQLLRVEHLAVRLLEHDIRIGPI